MQYNIAIILKRVKNQKLQQIIINFVHIRDKINKKMSYQVYFISKIKKNVLKKVTIIDLYSATKILNLFLNNVMSKNSRLQKIK
jgi:hypothetical protein